MMRILRRGLLFLPLALLFCWLLLVALIWQAPVAWLVQQAQSGVLSSYLAPAQRQQLQQVRWQQLDGSLGRGQAVALQLPGMVVSQVQWRVSFWRLLLLWPAAELQLGQEAPMALRLSALPTGRVKLRLQGGGLDALRGHPLPWALDGQLDGQLHYTARLTPAGPECLGAGGQLTGPLQVLQPLPMNLGEVQLGLNCQPGQLAGWSLLANRAGQHQVSLQGEAGAGQWRFEAGAQVREGAELQGILRLLNWRVQGEVSQGELVPGQVYRATGSGRF